MGSTYHYTDRDLAVDVVGRGALVGSEASRRQASNGSVSRSMSSSFSQVNISSSASFAGVKAAIAREQERQPPLTGTPSC